MHKIRFNKRRSLTLYTYYIYRVGMRDQGENLNWEWRVACRKGLRRSVAWQKGLRRSVAWRKGLRRRVAWRKGIRRRLKWVRARGGEGGGNWTTTGLKTWLTSLVGYKSVIICLIKFIALSISAPSPPALHVFVMLSYEQLYQLLRLNILWNYWNKLSAFKLSFLQF